MRQIIYPLFAMLVIGFVVILCEADHSETQREAQIDSISIYRQEIADLEAELTAALALQQCYHEELIRVVFECYPESIYTIPCNGRKVVVR